MVRMNAEISDDLLVNLVRRQDTSGDGALDLEDFTTLFIQLTQHEALQPLFRNLRAQAD
ncbi:phospholipase c-like protein [Leishmania tarentolae]|uniref:Phospholipase c-like protein n=1 Tax=Leishmania tarentolae TaxID=5689 RepID=A0A640KN48_LEITA|nr:phospholipase c-like protein [Leishmania tarentolae]